jgi:hypothetical protein
MASVTDLEILSPRNRLVGEVPRIGIRPAIDGRRKGVRESLEAQTMSMAQSVAAFLAKALRHPNGLPVECVVADTCIGGVAEAAQAAAKFAKAGVGVSLTVSPCWCYGAETMDMDPLVPKAIWGFNGTERPGAVYLASVLAAHTQKGLPAFGIYGHDVQDAGDTSIPNDVQEKLLAFARERGWTLPQMALAWLLQRRATFTVIAGADRPQHLVDNVKALEVQFTEEDLVEIDRITLVDEDRSVAPPYRALRPEKVHEFEPMQRARAGAPSLAAH